MTVTRPDAVVGAVGNGIVHKKSAYFKVAGAILAAAWLAGCAGQTSGIVASDEAFCVQSATADGGPSYDKCRSKLQSQRTKVSASNATRIEGTALLNTPAQPTNFAGPCKAADGKPCAPGEVTGTIKDATKP